MTSAQVAEQIKSIFPLFYIQGRSSRVIIDLRCSSFFIMQTDMLYTKKRKSLNFNNSWTYNSVFFFPAERQGFEPITLTAYISATLLSKFQIGNETVTIFRCWACPTLTAVCLPNFRVQRYGFLLKLANI